MRKAKLTGDVVAVMEVSQQSSLGVRTRAKTLALQKLQASKTGSAVPEAEHGGGELSYLQLRSRRLEKPPLQQSTCSRRQNPNPNPRIGGGGLRLGIEGDGEKVIEAGGEGYWWWLLVVVFWW